MSALQERQQVLALVAETMRAGARQAQACAVLGLSVRTLQRWREGETVRADQRPFRHHEPAHKLTHAERAQVLAVANSEAFGHLPPSQIVPRLADKGRYLASESTFYRVLKAANQLAHRRSERPAQCRVKPERCAPRHQTKCTAGTSVTCRQAFADSSFISICFSTFSAAKSSAGRSTKRKAAWSLARYCATCVVVKVSNPIRLPGIPITVAR